MRSQTRLTCLLLLIPSVALAYVAAPPDRKMERLQRLTGAILDEESPLSPLQIRQAQELSQSWVTTSRGTADDAVAVETILKRRVEDCKAGNNQAAPTTADYNVVLEAWARSREGIFAAERCEQILIEMQNSYTIAGDKHVQPDRSTFKIAIMAWRNALAGGGPNHNSNISSSTKRSGTDSQDASVSRALISQRAQRLLDWMTDLYTEGENHHALPDSDCFDIVLQSWARNAAMVPEAAERAQQLLGRMEKLSKELESPKLRPTTSGFNAVLSAYAAQCRRRPNEAEGWEKMVETLDFQESLYRVEGNDRVAPSQKTYSIVLGALSRIDHYDPVIGYKIATKADKILRHIEQDYRQGTLGWTPDTLLFNTVLGCWAKSHHNGAYRRAQSVLARQHNLHKLTLTRPKDYYAMSEMCKPDVIGTTSVLSACAAERGSPEDRKKAFRVALSTFQQWSRNPDQFHGSPNHVSYGVMFKACTRLLPAHDNDVSSTTTTTSDKDGAAAAVSTRQRWTRLLFDECKEKGLVGDMALNQLQQAATSRTELDDLLEGHQCKGTLRLPRSWTRNVQEKRYYPCPTGKGIRGQSRKRAEV